MREVAGCRLVDLRRCRPRTNPDHLRLVPDQRLDYLVILVLAEVALPDRQAAEGYLGGLIQGLFPPNL